MCDMTQSYMTRLIHIWYDSSGKAQRHICPDALNKCDIPNNRGDMTHSDVTWLIRMWHDSFIWWYDVIHQAKPNDTFATTLYTKGQPREALQRWTLVRLFLDTHSLAASCSGTNSFFFLSILLSLDRFASIYISTRIPSRAHFPVKYIYIYIFFVLVIQIDSVRLFLDKHARSCCGNKSRLFFKKKSIFFWVCVCVFRLILVRLFLDKHARSFSSKNERSLFLECVCVCLYWISCVCF